MDLSLRTRTVLVALVGLAAAATVTACSTDAGSDAGSDAGTAAGGSSAADEARSEIADVTSRSDRQDGLQNRLTDRPQTAGRSTAERAVIANGSLEISTGDVDEARRRARELTTTTSGIVASEQTDSDRRGRARTVQLVLRVPADRFDTVLDQLARLGRLEHRSQSAEDVTTRVIDNAARLRARRASVQRIERLYAEADTIGEVMSIEAQLAKRQAAVDSLEKQREWLADQTSLATITLTISRSSGSAADGGQDGFVGGLRAGWHGLATVAGVAVVAVGAALPFLGLLALIAIPLWALRRRLLRSRAPAAPAE